MSHKAKPDLNGPIKISNTRKKEQIIVIVIAQVGDYSIDIAKKRADYSYRLGSE